MAKKTKATGTDATGVVTVMPQDTPARAMTMFGAQTNAAVSMCTMFTVIESDADYKEGAEIVKGTLTLIKAIEEYYKPFKEAAYNTHKLLTSEEGLCVKPLKTAADALKQTLLAYVRIKEEKVRQDKWAAQFDAQKNAENERKARLKELEEAGKEEEAKTLSVAPIVPVVQAASLDPVVPKIDGMSFKRSWVVDAINASELPSQYLIPDEKAIAAVVAALGTKHGIPGVTVKEKDTVSIRT